MQFLAITGLITLTPCLSIHAKDIAHTLEFSCASDDQAGTANFRLSVQFGDGLLLALTEPASGKVIRLLYDAEVITGMMETAGLAQPMVFTRASSLRASLVGTAVKSNGDVVSLVVRSAAAGQTDRTYILFDSASAAVVHGSCRG